MPDTVTTDVSRWTDQGVERSVDEVAREVPVALTYNRRSHVVMMATPNNLEDLGLGFSLTEGLARSAEDIVSTRLIPREGGVELAMTVSESCFKRVQAQRRNMTGRTGCGLCGAESLDQALRVPGPVARRLAIEHGAVQRAIAHLQDEQALQSVTGAVHGAAWCDVRGHITRVREDVGRHNALDKLVGALSHSGFDSGNGFCLVSSRASYEMVYKAAAVGIELLVAVSAPTALALEYAQRCGVTLIGFARPGRHNVYTFPDRINQTRGA